MNNSGSLHELVNTHVTLEGVACDTDAGAVLRVHESVLYVQGLPSWPRDCIDKRVTLSGKIAVRHFIPHVGDNGDSVAVQGNSNEYYSIENAVVEMDKGNFGYVRLVHARDVSHGQHQEALQAIIGEMKKNNENSKEFFAKSKPDSTNMKLMYMLVHQDSFKVENLDARGNPSGRDRDAIYDLINKKVFFLYYQ